MSEKNMCEVCGSGNGRCGQCGNMCGWNGTHLLRWFLGILIIVWVFSIGMKIGEMKSLIYGNGYGYGHMKVYRSAMPMMGTYPAGVPTTGNVDVIYSTGVKAQ